MGGRINPMIHACRRHFAPQFRRLIYITKSPIICSNAKRSTQSLHFKISNFAKVVSAKSDVITSPHPKVRCVVGGRRRHFTENSREKLDKCDNTSSFVRMLPNSLRPYALLARVDKPIGTALLLWPCLWSTALAASQPGGGWDYLAGAPDPSLIALFTIGKFFVLCLTCFTFDIDSFSTSISGSFVMRGAGCTINDMWDKDFDRNVHRTKNRPLASGKLSTNQAIGFLGLQLSVGLGVLLSLPNMQYCLILGISSLPLVATYPLMKRYTNWPQLFLGMTFNWGAFMGWAASHGSLDPSVVLPLYASGVCWTLVYDTLYAHQDKVDDAKLGLKSTALHFGEHTKPTLYCFSGMTFLGWNLAGFGAGFTEPVYYIGSFAAFSHLLWQICSADLEDPDNLANRFKSNNHVGGIMFASCVAGSMASAMS